jgi:mutator protein MutT
MHHHLRLHRSSYTLLLELMPTPKKTVLSAGIIVVRERENSRDYLFLRAFRNWGFPKGEVEPGEAPRETAVRETQEETGLTELHFRWGEEFKETEPYNRGTKVARYYLAQTTEDRVVFAVNPQIGAPEHHEYRWLSGAELEKLAPPRLLPAIRWARDRVENMIDVTAAVLIENGRVLIARRRPGASQAGLWEFPGGKVRPGESPAQCLKREIREELGIEIEVEEFFAESVYAYDDKTIRLLGYLVRVESGELSANEHAELAWAAPAELSRYRFCPADMPFVERLQKIQ